MCVSQAQHRVRVTVRSPTFINPEPKLPAVPRAEREHRRRRGRRVLLFQVRQVREVLVRELRDV